MPTYAYACKTCGHAFDAVQSFTDPALTVCPECGGPLRKQYGTIGVTFNGPGFYRTDSRKKPAGGDSATTAPKTETTKKSETKKASPAPAGA